MFCNLGTETITKYTQPMDLLTYVTKNNIITRKMTLKEFFNISLYNTPVTTAPTRKKRKEVFELVKENIELDSIRKIHRNLSGKEIKKSSSKYANHLEDKILAKQESDSSWWG